MQDMENTKSTITIEEDTTEDYSTRLSDKEVSEMLKRNAIQICESKTDNKETIELYKKIIEAKKGFFLGKVYVGGITAGIITDDGVVYTSSCISGESGLEVCAERVALMNAIDHGHTKFRKVMAVKESFKIVKPCGVCLEFLKQIEGDDVEVYIDFDKTVKVKDLLK